MESTSTRRPDGGSDLMDTAQKIPTLELRGFSYDEQRHIVPALLDALALCGCYVEEQRTLSPNQSVLSFEVHLGSAFDLYSELVTAGVDLNRDSHLKMMSLCTLGRHNLRRVRRWRPRSVRLALSFLDHNLEFAMMATGVA